MTDREALDAITALLESEFNTAPEWPTDAIYSIRDILHKTHRIPVMRGEWEEV